MRKPRYRWSYLYHVWMLQSRWARLAPPQVWPSTLMPVLIERRPGESDASVAARWRKHFDVDERGLRINPHRLGGYDA